jgi:hypothetical protein
MSSRIAEPILMLLLTSCMCVWFMSAVGTNPIYAIPSITTASGSSPDSATSTAAATGVGLDLDDYLLGLTSLPNELSRLCINSVRVGNYELPRQVAAFISDLYSGFRLLHLTNGDLRRRFDAIKYAVAKVEEVLYDCTVRGLGTSASASSSSNAAVNAASKPLAVGSQEAAPVGADSDVTMQ